MKEYQTEDLVVLWYPELCSHPGICTRLLPAVFDKERRPWIDLSRAEALDIINCIDRCPSGALRYTLPAGSKIDPALAKGPGSLDFAETDESPVVLKASASGPMIVTGPLTVVEWDGSFVRRESRTVLCGCGKTQNRPFCDGAHLNRDEGTGKEESK